MLYGRNEELRWLRARFDAIAERDADGAWPGPRMAVVVAESGIGKSRLVQELYLQLTHDPAWDPSESDYWPDAFGDGGINLAVTPDMRGHVPNGPPRFAWLGARWQSPDERSVVTRRSALPDLRSSVMVHAEILRSHGSAWSDAARRAMAVARDEGIGAVADAVGIPFFGLVTRLAGSLKDFAEDRMAGGRSFEQVEAEEVTSEVDEVLDCMRLLLDGKGALPTILWLDDGHWIDDESRAFVHRLWLEATRRRWPLLVVATHWEREWRELAPSRGGLHAFEGQPGVDVWHMTDAGTEALREYLRSQFPGLEPAQQSLLIEKAGGNFLTMVENVGELRRHPANFVGEDPTRPLSPAGQHRVRKWESMRDRHVQLRFGDLDRDVKDLLGWGSHIGQRFLRGVIEEFATHVRTTGAATLVDRCVDPYVILGRAGEHTREFRDRAYYAVATDHFGLYCEHHAVMLSEVLRKQLVEWVQNSFDEDGAPRWPQGDGARPGPARMATALADNERRELLALAVRELALGSPPDWTRNEDVAAVRAVYLCAVNAQRERAWATVEQVCRRLEPLTDIPEGVLAVAEQEWLAKIAFKAGGLAAAETLARSALAHRQRSEPGSVLALLASMRCVGDVQDARGALVDARQTHEACLVLGRRLAAESQSPEAWRDVATSLERIGETARKQGILADALAAQRECLSIRRRLVAEAPSTALWRELAVSLQRLARIEEQQGALDSALARNLEGLSIRRRLAEELRTAESRRVLLVGLGWVGWLEFRLGQLSQARARWEERLALARALAQEVGTPESRRDLSISLGDIAELEYREGSPSTARQHMSESLALARDLSGQISRRAYLNGVAWRVHVLATCLIDTGQTGEALALLSAEGDAVSDLESEFADDLSVQRTCATFWEACARAHRALGKDADATWCEERAAGLRQRIAGTK